MIKMFVKKIFISAAVPCAGAAEHRQKEGDPMGKGWYKALEDLVCAKEHLKRAKKEKPRRVGFNSHF